MPYNQDAVTQSLYIHWPFCPYRCHFCPFVTVQNQDHFMGQYHAALTREMREYFAETSSADPIKTIYIGGGTPSTYPDDMLRDMIGVLKSSAQWSDDIEITLEVNPGTVRPEQIPLWHSLGITRLSIGVQSLNDKVLANLNRHQTQKDVFWLLPEAAPYFDLSVDLIIGLPGVSDDEWRDMMSKLVTWPIKHCSMYFLSIHEGTPLYFRIHTKKDVSLACDDRIVDLYQWSVSYLQANGFEQYEVSNFARPGHHSRHNQMYWDHQPYKGFGLGACSFDGERRIQNDKNIVSYLKKVETGEDLSIFEETLTEDQRWFERLMLGMRRANGVVINDIIGTWSAIDRSAFQQRLNALVARKLVEIHGERVALTTSGLALENEVVVQLTMKHEL